MKTDIKNLIQEELQEFDRPITIIRNWNFSQRDTIEQSILYFNSRFVDGDEVDGFKQFFYNIVRPACGTTTKAIDIDTKDIILLTAPGGNSLKTWFYQRSLKNWFKRREFGKVLNKICEDLPIYGSVVLKKVNGDVKFVNLKNFVCEQNADSLDQSNYIIEQHLYTEIEFKRIGDEKGWDNVDEIIKIYRGSKEQYIRVFERYGTVEKDDGSVKYEMVLVADIPNDIKLDTEQQYTINNTVILAEKELDTHPYFEIHIFKIPGRWLGVGVPEILFDPQIRINEVNNQESKSSYWASKRLWQTKDRGTKRNLLGNSKDGDILSVDEYLEVVPMEDRNGATYINQKNDIKTLSQELTFSYDVVRGSRTPAGTPLGSAQLSATMSLSYFDQMKENISLEIKKLLYEYILPSFKKDATKAHIVRIAGEDLDKMVDMMIETKSRKSFFDFVEKNGRLPDPEFMNSVREINKEALKTKAEVMVGVEEGWFDDVMYDIDIVITDESLDATTQAQNLVTALQTITTDPTILQDPTKKKIFGKYLESGGINLADLEASIPKGQVGEIMETQGAGGGVSATRPGQPSVRTRTRQL